MPEEAENQIEKRKYIRIRAQHMLMHEKYILNPLDDEELVEGLLGNYSAGGVLFESKTKYNIGDLLKLEISIPGWEQFKNEFYKEDAITPSRPIIVLAKIIHVENIVVDELYDIGVCFVGIDENHRWALMKQIDAESKKQKPEQGTS